MIATKRWGWRWRRHLAVAAWLLGASLTAAMAVADGTDTGATATGYSGRPMSLRFEAAPITTVLDAFAEFTGLNFVTATTEATGTITMRLEDVPWDQALEVVLRAAGLAAQRRGNLIWVAPAEQIDKHEQRRRKIRNEQREHEPLVSVLVPVHYAKAVDLAALLKSIKAVDSGVQPSLFGSVHIGEVQTERNSLLSTRGTVSADHRTNTLLLQDSADRISDLRKMIEQLDRPVPQVLIETRIVEAFGDFSKDLGVRLGLSATYHAGADGIAAGGRLGAPTATITDPGDALGVNLAATPVHGAAPGSLAFSLLRIGGSLGHLVGLELSALESEGRGRIIASPRLVTADQQEAHIEQGQERVYTAAGGNALIGGDRVITKKAVLGLTVTPRITPGKRLILDVFITQDSFADTSADTLNTKQLTTRVLLNNGETVMIGGIYQKENRRRQWRVPGLGKLPVIGRLFRKDQRFDLRSELLIFLTPHILDETQHTQTTQPAANGGGGGKKVLPR